MSRIRFDYRLLERRYHVITSPDLKGLHVSADSRRAAEREALLVLAVIREKTDQRDVLKAVEYEPV